MKTKSKTTFEAERRVKAPGELIELPDGTAHFEWHGREDGEIIVLVHGFSTPSFVWRGILPPLIAQGYRVLTYDHFGRGWSDRPDASYSLAFHHRQLKDLLAQLEITKPFYLIGYSMGGLIAADFAARLPEKVNRLFLIAPAGLGTSLSGVPSALRWPIIGPWLAETVMKRRLLADMQKPENAGASLPDLFERYQEQAQYAGYMRALRKTLLNFSLGSAPEVYESLAKTSISCAALWGSNDTVTPPSGAEQLKKMLPTAQVHVEQGATHAITYAQADTVARALLEHAQA